MKASNYMNAASLVEFLKVGILASELDIIAANTKKTAKSKMEKEWARKMRMAATMMENVITERMEALEQKARDSVERRNNHVRMLMESKDPVRVGKSNKSRGTQNMIQQMRALGKPVEVIIYPKGDREK